MRCLRNLGPKINGPALDGKYFFFSRALRDPGVPPQHPDRSRNGLGDIYQMDLDALLALPE